MSAGHPVAGRPLLGTDNLPRAATGSRTLRVPGLVGASVGIASSLVVGTFARAGIIVAGIVLIASIVCLVMLAARKRTPAIAAATVGLGALALHLVLPTIAVAGNLLGGDVSGFGRLGTALVLCGPGLVGLAFALVSAGRIDPAAEEARRTEQRAERASAEALGRARWEAAYPGASAGHLPPTYASGGLTPARTNVTAALALAFGLCGGLLGIVLGHVALTQIAATGERGRGMAIAGLVLGYVSLAAIVTVVVVLLSVST